MNNFISITIIIERYLQKIQNSKLFSCWAKRKNLQFNLIRLTWNGKITLKNNYCLYETARVAAVEREQAARDAASICKCMWFMMSREKYHVWSAFLCWKIISFIYENNYMCFIAFLCSLFIIVCCGSRQWCTLEFCK